MRAQVPRCNKRCATAPSMDREKLTLENLTARFQYGKPHFTEPMSRRYRVYRVSLSRHDSPVNPRISSLTASDLLLDSHVHRRKYGENSCAADLRPDLPPAFTHVDEFSRFNTRRACVHKCPAATKGVPPPRQHTEKSEARTTQPAGTVPEWQASLH